MSPRNVQHAELLKTLKPLLMAATSDQPAPAKDNPEQRAAIALLRRDPEARELYTPFMTTSAMLELEHARPLTQQKQVQGSGFRVQEKTTRALSRRRSVWYAAAAMIALAVTAWFVLPEPRTPNAEPSTARIAMLTGAEDAVFGDSPEPMNLGAELTPGRFVLESGSVQLMYHNGAAVDLYGPCLYEVIGPQTGYLHHGSMHVLVPPRARGFTVRTPHCDVVDLGTEFNLRVGAVGPMSVAVTQGIVELRDLAGRVLRQISAGVAVGVTPAPGSDTKLDLREYALGDVADAYTGGATELVASYTRDFNADRPAANWSYLWNAPIDFGEAQARRMNTGPISDPACYRALLPTPRGGYTVDGDLDNVNGSPGRYLRLSSIGGHPGRGSRQPELYDVPEPVAGAIANDLDRYAIVAWTCDAPGFYTIRRSNLALNTPELSRGVMVRVFTSRRPQSPIVQGCVTRSEGDFDTDLGYLTPGDVIYIALGPDQQDGSDSFTWDFDIIRSQAWAGPIPHQLENVQ